MGVFKTYLRICRKKISVILIYMGIFAGALFLFSREDANTSKTFDNTKIRTAFINHDTDSVLVQGLYEFLGEYCEFIVVLPDQVDDALFIREIEYLVEIEKGFEENFLNGKTVTIKKQSIPDSFTSISVNGAINNYLNTARVLNTHLKIDNASQLAEALKTSMASRASVELFDKDTGSGDKEYYEIFFNYLSYIMVACFILIVGTIMTTFQRLPIKRRNLVAPISIRRLNMQLMLSNLAFVMVFLFVFLVFGVATSQHHQINEYFMFYTFNAFSFCLVALAISYLFGITLKNTKALTLVSTVVSLGFAFLGGVFVPQEMLNGGTLKIARYIPSYWYVLNNSKISKLTNFSIENVSEIVKFILLQTVLAMALFAIALIYSQIKRKQEA